MDAKTFLDNFGTIADAPGGVDRLRELILHLAISGRLVDQLRSEEPVGLALAEVRAEKGNVLSAKMKGRSKVPREPEPWEINREAPRGWCWARVDDTGEYVNGLAFKQGDWYDDGLPIIRIQNLTNPNADFNYARGSFPEDRTVDDGDILVSWSATLAAFVWDRGPAVVNQHIFKVIPELRVVAPGFLYHLLRHTIRELAASDAAHGLAMKHINRGPFVSHVVGIPPLEEQERIVAKVDELMQLCDDLEARQQTRHHVTTRLRASSLDALTNAETDDDLHTAWSRIHTNWETLTDHPDSIETLRQTILQLAVRGKLVPQDPHEGSGADLIETITRSNSGIEVGANVAPKPVAQLHSIPSSWMWVQLGAVTDGIEAGKSPTAQPRPKSGDEWGVLKVSACSWGSFWPDENKALLPGTTPQARFEVQPGDFLISRANTQELVARSVVVRDTPRHLLISDKTLRLTPSFGCDPQYLNLANLASAARSHYERNASGTSDSMRNVSQAVIKSAPIPLPPAGEQRRVVRRYQALIELCDDLEVALERARTANEQFAAAVTA